MKKLVLITVVLLVFGVSCSKNDDADPVVPEKSVREKLYGKWKLTEYIVNSVPLNVEDCYVKKNYEFFDYNGEVNIESYSYDSGYHCNKLVQAYDFFAGGDDLYFRLPNYSGPDYVRYKIIELTDTTLKLEEYYVKTSTQPSTSKNDFSTWKRVK